MARVSVIIPCYRQGRFLAEAIDSALMQDKIDREVIVVNDGSPDEARDVALAYGDAIRYVEQENRGAAAARNAGIAVATGEYIAFLDADDAYLPGALAKLAGALDRYDRLGLVCGEAELFGANGENGRKSSISGRPRHPESFRWETVDYLPTTSTVMVRRRCLVAAGPFDERLTSAGEDWLMCVRLSLVTDMMYLDTPICRYRVHAGSVSRRVEEVAAQNRLAVDSVVKGDTFARYPASFRARLLYYRLATAWRAEPKMRALRYLVRAVVVDPLQVGFGARVAWRGLRATWRRAWREGRP